MNTIIIATISASILYLLAAFVATVHDRIKARRDATVINYDTIFPTPAKWVPIRPLPIVQPSYVHRCLGIRPLRDEIKRRGLAAKGYETHGKTWSRCTQNQLIAVLEG